MAVLLIGAAAGALIGLALGQAWMGSSGGARVSRVAGDGRPGPRPEGAIGAWRPRGSTPGQLQLPAAGAAAAAGWAVFGMAGLIVAPVAAVAGMRQIEMTQRRRRARERERGVGALARCLADGLRGGRSIRGALQAAATDRSVSPALRDALDEVDAALRRGATVPHCLVRLAATGGPQLTLLAAAVALHAERGGPLISELDALAEDADRAVVLDEERAAATAQARATVRMVAALPLFALGAAQLLGGGFLQSLAANPASLALLCTGLLLEVLAVLITRRLIASAA